MAVITIANAKGGTGKTTLAPVIAQVLAGQGHRTTLIEADPNTPLQAWYDLDPARHPQCLHLISGVDENTILDRIADTSARHAHVIIDLEGTANITTIYALSQSDLVLVPLQGSQMDADQAMRVVQHIHDQRAIAGRAIPFALVFTRTSMIEPRDFRHIRAQMKALDLPVLESELTDRAAFRAMMQSGDTIYTLGPDDVHNPASAVENAEALVSHIQQHLQKEQAA